MRSAYGKAPIFANLSTVCFEHVREENEGEENEDALNTLHVRISNH